MRSFHTPDPRTGRALSHPSARLERAEAQLRGGLLAPPTPASLVALADELLSMPHDLPISLRAAAPEPSQPEASL